MIDLLSPMVVREMIITVMTEDMIGVLKEQGIIQDTIDLLKDIIQSMFTVFFDIYPF